MPSRECQDLNGEDRMAGCSSTTHSSVVKIVCLDSTPGMLSFVPVRGGGIMPQCKSGEQIIQLATPISKDESAYAAFHSMRVQMSKYGGRWSFVTT